MIDKTNFFMEATLRICSSLEIEIALWKCLLFLKDIMPVNRMMFSVYDYELGILDYIADATFTGGQSVTKQLRLSSDIQKDLKENWEQGIHHIEKLGENKLSQTLSQTIAKEFDILYNSAIHMDLMLENEEVGMVALINDSDKSFTDEHMELIKLLNKPFAIAVTNALRYRELKRIKDVLQDDNQYLRAELRNGVGNEIVGADMGLKGVMDLVHQVSGHDSPVLLLGETGTGKEVIANAIHNLSDRKNGPFIKINCGAIPDSLVDSELFGHEKGAFTGAISQKRGRFERAHNGTLFLDEIGELPLNAQVRLLRVLQEKGLERVGGTSPVKVDVRVITATHRDLEAMLKAGKFREDLYFRIKVFPITIPPLRERTPDIPMLVPYLIQKKSRELKKAPIPQPAPHSMDRLMAYQWPGNIRELENVVERALIMNRGEPIVFDGIIDDQFHGNDAPAIMEKNDIYNLDKVTANHIKRVLEISEGKIEGIGGAASLLGVNPNTLRNRMKKLGVPFGRMAKTTRNNL